MATSVPRLRYFMFPGRCYAARIAMFNAFGKEGWIDERIGQTQFKKLKAQAAEDRKDPTKTSVLSTNNLPQLTLADGITTVTQSHAIARWAARQPSRTGSPYSLYPPSNEGLDASLLVDEAMAMVDSLVGFAPKDADKQTRLEKRKEYSGEGGPLYIGMAILENRLERSSARGAFLLGADLSIADLYLKKPLTDMILDKQFEGVLPEYLERFPYIRAHTDAVAAHPLVEEYLKHYKN